MSEEYLKYLDESHYQDTLNDDVNDNINETLKKIKSSYKIPDYYTAEELKIKGRKKRLKKQFEKMLKDDIVY